VLAGTPSDFGKIHCGKKPRKLPKAFIEFLASPEAILILKAIGLEPG